MKYYDKVMLYEKESRDFFDRVCYGKIDKFINMIFEAYDNQRTIFACANGGGAAFVQNFVIDLNLHPFVSEDKNSQIISRNNFKCVNLCSDQASITGISNDLGFEFIFSELLKFQGKKDDLVFAFSGSGNSRNILQLFKVAKERGMKNILVTRNENNKCNDFSDLVICPTNLWESNFPGQTGGNNFNFVAEDFVSKLTHIAVGLLKQKVQDEHVIKCEVL